MPTRLPDPDDEPEILGDEEDEEDERVPDRAERRQNAVDKPLKLRQINGPSALVRRIGRGVRNLALGAALGYVGGKAVEHTVKNTVHQSIENAQGIADRPINESVINAIGSIRGLEDFLEIKNVIKRVVAAEVEKAKAVATVEALKALDPNLYKISFWTSAIGILLAVQALIFAYKRLFHAADPVIETNMEKIAAAITALQAENKALKAGKTPSPAQLAHMQAQLNEALSNSAETLARLDAMEVQLRAAKSESQTARADAQAARTEASRTQAELDAMKRAATQATQHAPREGFREG